MKTIKQLFMSTYFFSALAFSMGKAPSQLQDGDLVFQTSTSSQSQAIQLATHSKWSHMGIVTYKSGVAYVYEARGPVGYRKLSSFISTGVGGRYMVRRLKTGLSPMQLASLKKVGAEYAQKPYDPYFGWDNSRIYCSELPWKMFYRALRLSIGSLEKLEDLDLSHPVVQAKLKERYGDDIPYDETVITPRSIAESDLFETVFQN